MHDTRVLHSGLPKHRRQVFLRFLRVKQAMACRRIERRSREAPSPTPGTPDGNAPRLKDVHRALERPEQCERLEVRGDTEQHLYIKERPKQQGSKHGGTQQEVGAVICYLPSRVRSL